MPALKNNCNRDDLFCSFIDPRYSSSASAFCSTYIRPTVTKTKTTTTTVTAIKNKRDLPATAAFPASRLSSACSCILAAVPTPTTAVTTVVTTKTTTKTSTPPSCSVATPIVKNGDFETGSLAPWTLTPYSNYEDQYLTYGLKSPGFGGSKYAAFANDNLAGSYVRLDLEQSLTVCAGAKYKFTAKYYLTDPGEQCSKKMKRQACSKQVFIYGYVDDKTIVQSTEADPAGPLVVWRTFTGTFTAASNVAKLRIQFVTTDFLGVEWAVDNVVVTPA